MKAPPTRRRLVLAYLGDPYSIHTVRWLGSFARRGHDVHLIRANDRPLSPDLDERITLHPFPAPSRYRVRFSGTIQARRRLHRLLMDIGADVLHAHYLTGYGWLARLSGFRPFVVTVWGSDVFVTARDSPVARVWAWAALRGASLVTADSTDLAEAAIDLGARRQRVRIIQFGVETSRFTPGPASAELRQRLGLGPTRIIFGPRSITPIYHTLTAVEAMPQLPDDVSLVLTATNAEAPYLDAVRDRIRSLQLEDRVRIVAGIEHAEMVDYYRLADVVVSIPQSDGTPVSVLEAMSCGRTVVATDLPSVREWLAPVTPGLLVPAGDEAATAAAIVRALELDDDQIGPRLREIVIDRADHERNMTEMEGEYLALAGRR